MERGLAHNSLELDLGGVFVGIASGEGSIYFVVVCRGLGMRIPTLLECSSGV